jgi:hypothetical protein
VNIGIGYNCNAWSPEADTIDKGVEFTQERTCDQDQGRDKNTYFVDIDGNKTLSKTEKEHKTIGSTEEQQAIGTYDILGFIYLLRSQHNTSALNINDVTKVNEPTWNDYFGQTYDIVINGVSYANQRLSNTGVIEWFNPDKRLYLNFGEGCWTNDVAHGDIEYLDENNNVVFWHRTRSYGSYGLYATYGTQPNFAGGIDPGFVGPYPAFRGWLSFDKDARTVTYTKNASNNYVNSWQLTNIDVESIKKIRVAYSNVMTTYTGGTCGAQASIEVVN